MASPPPAEPPPQIAVATPSENIQNDTEKPGFDTVIIKTEIEDSELQPEEQLSLTEADELIVPEPVNTEPVMPTEYTMTHQNAPAEPYAMEEQYNVQVKIEPVDPEPNRAEFNAVIVKIEKEEEPAELSPVMMEININPILYPREEIQQKIQDGFTISNNRYNCNFCTRNFARLTNVINHVKTHMGNLLNQQCYLCFKTFKNQKMRDQHLVTHGFERPFQCEKCKKTFKMVSHLKNHVNKNCCSTYGDLTCKICGQIFPYMSLYKSHLVKHETEKKFSCDVCKMNFKHKSAVTRHMLQHTGIKNFECNLCNKKFYLKGLLKTHLKSHSTDRPFVCPICTKTFALKHNLKKHLVIHTRPKKLICDICHKRFPRESRLKYHMQVHTREKKFSCDICKRFFSHKHNVVRHLVNRHTEIMNKDFVDSLKY